MGVRTPKEGMDKEYAACTSHCESSSGPLSFASEVSDGTVPPITSLGTVRTLADVLKAAPCNTSVSVFTMSSVKIPMVCNTPSHTDWLGGN